MRKETLEIRCGCGHYNVVPSLKVFLKFRVLDEKQARVIRGLLPAYKVSDIVKCEKCGTILAHAGELFTPRTQSQTPTKHKSLKWLFYELTFLNPARFHLADVVPGLKRELVHSLSMTMPPLHEQQEIAEILTGVNKKLEIERNEKAKLERIKQGLMDLLLTGKIRIKVDY